MRYQHIPLSSSRLLLRDFEEQDWTAIYSFSSDPEVMRFLQWDPFDEDESRKLVRRAISQRAEVPRLHFELAVVLKSEQMIVGRCSIHVVNVKNSEGRIGYCLDRRFWGQGYATEAAQILLSFGFDELKLHRIFATCDSRNVASSHVLEKLGMRQEGHFREDVWQKGIWRDTLLFAMLETDWRN